MALLNSWLNPVNKIAADVAHTVGRTTGIDVTPDFNITANAGGGIPFVQRNGAQPTAPTGGLPTNGAVQGAFTNPAGGGSGNLTNGGGGGINKDAQERAAALFGIEQGLSSANDGLGRLDRQAQSGYGNIDRQYQDAYNRLIGQKQIGERNYTTNRNDQLNQYLGARNQNNTQARSWMDGAKRTLGANGAGGGSAARYGVPFQAQSMATEGNSAAQATNNRNITTLDRSWQDDQNEIQNSMGDLSRQKDQGYNDYRSQVENQRAELLNTIGTLTGQRQIANGGDYKAALAAANPYTSRISGILNSIDGLAATPAIQERAVTLDRPDLSGYNWAAPEQQTAAVQDPTLSNPLMALFGLQDDRQQQYV